MLGLLIPSDEIANVFTIVAKVAAFNLGFHPAVLLFSQRDGFPVHAHG
ncbi:hypothetical protein HALA3H3_640018 [Halomonas sp. A3H3]|nr:hypothetical protein HALA3H3_640018 [Halomonas sp. A3H3]